MGDQIYRELRSQRRRGNQGWAFAEISERFFLRLFDGRRRGWRRFRTSRWKKSINAIFTKIDYPGVRSGPPTRFTSTERANDATPFRTGSRPFFCKARIIKKFWRLFDNVLITLLGLHVNSALDAFAQRASVILPRRDKVPVISRRTSLLPRQSRAC